MSSLPCVDCFNGSLHPGTPTGTETTIHDLPTYVSQPPDGAPPKGIIVMIPDAYGWRMPNNRLLCDIYAKKGGYLVYLPDFMGGSELPQSNMPLMAELTTPSSWTHTILSKPFLLLKALRISVPPMIAMRSSVCAPRVLNFFQNLRTSPPPFASPNGPLKIGVAAFCWGGQHAISLAQNASTSQVERHTEQDPTYAFGKTRNPMQLIDCAFTAHPSFLSIPKDLEAVDLPLSVIIGDTDMAISASKVQVMKSVLEEKAKKEEGPLEGCYECVVLEGALHGFAVRSCVTNEKQMGYAGVAEKQALDWFARWMDERKS